MQKKLKDVKEKLSKAARQLRRSFAFTLAEVLITLGVIGVIAAMTLPTVIKHYQQKVTIERLKATYSLIYQAVRRSEVDNGTLDTWEIPAESQVYSVGKVFADKYFTPYLKKINECETRKCFSEYSYHLDGEKINNTSTRYALELANGVVISFFPRGFCCEIGIDVNGKKGPNTVGKDIFTIIVTNQSIPSASTFYFGIQEKPGVYFWGQGQTNSFLKNSAYACSKTKGKGYRGMNCGAWIMQSGWKIPDGYPW